MMKIAVKQERPIIPATCRNDFRNVITSCWQHDPTLRPDASGLIIMIERIKPDLPPPVDILERTLVLPMPTMVLTVAFDPPAPVPQTSPNQRPRSPPHIQNISNHNLAPALAPAPTLSPTHSPPKTPLVISNPSLVVPPPQKKKQTCPYDMACYRFNNQQHNLEEAHPVRDSYLR